MTCNREKLISKEYIFNKQKYFRWLCNIIDVDDLSTDYEFMLDILFNMDFIWSWRIPKDENRAVEGVALREKYCVTEGYYLDDNATDDWECSVLEMLVALSIRVEELVNDLSYSTDDPGKWFWQFCTNLDILRDDENYIRQEVTYWLNRNFQTNGVGSPFPLKHYCGNQRKTDIWMQMQHYLSEYTGFEMEGSDIHGVPN